eukprot:gnl/TRDRNA2_/TRDRNA2_123909_c1_seq1.p2 gnl/TRDRNA2_/TRDRNA2_123909_c1~~gnl/TRDRNA2_/TRDRNA2_123909_c1_seq1.p2  ORF type:complete len:100 (-),score=13.49 gnl/TRDRNA2_/TRDRNA2_123909_c1_seq1:359-658(-)
MCAAEAMQRLLGDFRAQEFTNTIWAFAISGHASMPLFTVLAWEEPREWCIDDFNPQNVSNATWAFAMTIRSQVPLFAGLVISAECRVNEFSVLELTNMI